MKFVNYVLDNIHGFIGLTEVENEIEQLPIFQRLRRLNQLGLASWIFPGAEHTRYIHSLGVMHIIDQMAVKLGFNDEKRQLLRLAGMLHDIGHYPLSHTGEGAYETAYNNIQSGTVGRDFYVGMAADLRGSIDKLRKSKVLSHCYMEQSDNIYHHERIGIDVIRNSSKIKQAMERHCSYIDIEDICAIITGDIVSKPQLSVEIQMLHSEMDADRIDYLLRDATSSGTSYGKFEIGALIKSLAVSKHNSLDIEVLGVSAKGIGPAEQFLINRFMSYSQVIYQKHVAVLEVMATKVMAWMSEETSFIHFPSPQNLLDWMKRHEETRAYLDFTDNAFLSALALVKTGEYGCPDEIGAMAEKLRQYRALCLKADPLIFSGKDQNSLNSKIKDQELFKQLVDDTYLRSNKRIGIVNKLTLTGHVQEAAFCSEYASVADEQYPALNEYLKHRLLHGVAYVPESGDPSLVIDLPFSILKELSMYTTVLVREYSID